MEFADFTKANCFYFEIRTEILFIEYEPGNDQTSPQTLDFQAPNA